MAARQKIYNISATCSFVDVLAQKFLAEYVSQPSELSKVLFLLPNRRAVQNLSDAFVRQNGRMPTILPQMKPIGDVEEDEVFLTGNAEILKNLPPAVSTAERALILTKLIMRRPNYFGTSQMSLSQAYQLAQNLATLMDTAYQENLDFAKLPELVEQEYAAHWQETLKLLSIITENWPLILKEQGKVDEIARRNILLEQELAVWQQSKTTQRIVIAGTTAAFGQLKQLVQTVLNLPNGEVYLAGLDGYLSAEDWQKIDENHPQFELKELLEYLQIGRSEVPTLDYESITPREMLVAECMRPAETTEDWRHLREQHLPPTAWDGLKLINCEDARQEALAIALIMRQTLETPEKTVALVTPDRNLSRRVAAELKRWNIEADDSAGQPLSLTPIGVYLRLIINVVENDFSQTSQLALMKHPFCACGLARGAFYQQVRHIELAWRRQKDLTAEQENLLQDFARRLQPLKDLYEQPATDIKALLKAHIKAAESLADTDLKTGEKIIWKQDAGRNAAQFFSTFVESAGILEAVAPNDYGVFLTLLLSAQNVRRRYGLHRRIKILGLIEARLNKADVTIIGGVNEGIWPHLPSADMWLSRPMKQEFGMSLPERAIGVIASDFAQLLSGKEVYLTRSERMDGAPAQKSRWWLRLETVMAADFGDDKQKMQSLYDTPFSAWAKYMERATVLKSIEAPKPCPPLEMRPREISASNVEVYMTDPYSIFAKYILGLKPLEDLDAPADARDYGNLVHKVLEEFNRRYKTGDYPANAKQILEQIAETEFAAMGIDAELKMFWRARLAKTLDWLVQTEQVYRPRIDYIFSEVQGERQYQGPVGVWKITARADRLEQWSDGSLCVVDYKTGSLPKNIAKLVKLGYKPQLSIEGLIAASGGFTDVAARPIKFLRYWQMDGQEILLNEAESNEAMQHAEQNIRQLIAAYDDPNRAYLTKPNPKTAPAQTDYDHLSRYLEWAVKDDSEDNDGDD